jgi:putative endonuclease
MPFFVYLLHSQRTERHYIGQTADLAKRLKAHNTGLVRTTRRGRPWSLVGYESYESRSDARWRERNLKLHSDKKAAFIRILHKIGR